LNNHGPETACNINGASASLETYKATISQLYLH
jgi:hypothetical protein